MPSSGAVELADVKRDWWCTSFPAALLGILRFPELQREGKGLSAFFALTLDPKLDVFAILCQGFKFKDFEQFPIPQMLSSSMEEVVLQSKADTQNDTKNKFVRDKKLRPKVSQSQITQMTRWTQINDVRSFMAAATQKSLRC